MATDRFLLQAHHIYPCWSKGDQSSAAKTAILASIEFAWGLGRLHTRARIVKSSDQQASHRSGQSTHLDAPSRSFCKICTRPSNGIQLCTYQMGRNLSWSVKETENTGSIEPERLCKSYAMAYPRKRMSHIKSEGFLTLKPNAQAIDDILTQGLGTRLKARGVTVPGLNSPVSPISCSKSYPIIPQWSSNAGPFLVASFGFFPSSS